MHTLIGIQHLAAGVSTGFVFDPNYGWVLLVASIIAFSIILFSFIFPGRLRKTIFNEEFMKSNFGEAHKAATGT